MHLHSLATHLTCTCFTPHLNAVVQCIGTETYLTDNNGLSFTHIALRVENQQSGSTCPMYILIERRLLGVSRMSRTSFTRSSLHLPALSITEAISHTIGWQWFHACSVMTSSSSPSLHASLCSLILVSNLLLSLQYTLPHSCKEFYTQPMSLS